jgi:hypothetical protein
MSEHDADLDQLLEASNPVREEEFPLPADSPSAQFLYEKITGIPYAGTTSRRLRRPWFGPGLAAFLAILGLGVGGAYAYATITQHVTEKLAVTCYAGANLQTEAVQVIADSAGPVSTCAKAWAAGHVGVGPPPLLVACVTPQGVAAVFASAPGADVCGQLGLPPLPAGANNLHSPASTVPTSTTVAVGTLLPSLRDTIITEMQTRCLTAADANATVTGLLAKAGVHWAVVVPAPFPAGHPCASPGFDEAKSRGILTGIPPPAHP